MVLLDIERPYRIDVSKFRSKSKNSPYDGRPVQGLVLTAMLIGCAAGLMLDTPRREPLRPA